MTDFAKDSRDLALNIFDYWGNGVPGTTLANAGVGSTYRQLDGGAGATYWIRGATGWDSLQTSAWNQTLADTLYARKAVGETISAAWNFSVAPTIGGYIVVTSNNFATYGDALYSPLGHTHTFASLTSVPTTISGYGITDFNSLGDARWSLLGHTHTFASLTSKPTTISGYGITDFTTRFQAESLLDSQLPATAHFATRLGVGGAADAAYVLRSYGATKVDGDLTLGGSLSATSFLRVDHSTNPYLRLVRTTGNVHTTFESYSGSGSSYITHNGSVVLELLDAGGGKLYNNWSLQNGYLYLRDSGGTVRSYVSQETSHPFFILGSTGDYAFTLNNGLNGGGAIYGPFSILGSTTAAPLFVKGTHSVGMFTQYGNVNRDAFGYIGSSSFLYGGGDKDDFEIASGYHDLYLTSQRDIYLTPASGRHGYLGGADWTITGSTGLKVNGAITQAKGTGTYYDVPTETVSTVNPPGSSSGYPVGHRWVKVIAPI